MQRRPEYRFHILFVVALLICWVPVARTVPGAGPILEGLLYVGLFAGIYAVSERRRQMVIAIALATATGVVRLIMLIEHNPALAPVASTLSLVFFAYIAAVILGAVFRAPRVDTQTIIGAITVYVLAGISFAMAYMAIEQISPGNFIVSTGEPMYDFEQHGSGTIASFIYFSFVTLSTLGYGDIQPVSNIVRHLAMTEAVVGQLYIAVLIARLVGLKISHDSLGAP